MTSQLSSFAGTALLLVPLAACSDGAGRAADPPLMSVIASDFSFRAPDTIAAGLIRVRMTNAGILSRSWATAWPRASGCPHG